MHDDAEAHARVLVHRRKNLWPACNGSGVWYDRLSYPPRSSCAADDRPRAFPEMNASSAPVASIGDAERPGSTIPAESEEHTSELQSHHDLVCRLLLEKKKNIKT